MFSGLVKELGRVSSWDPASGKVQIQASQLLHGAKVGDSFAVNGVCLTLVAVTAQDFTAFVAPETQQCTTFSLLKEGDEVNLETCLTLSEPLGGHLVTGHVDSAVNCIKLVEEGESLLLTCDMPKNICPFIAKKGSVTLNGVSLTVCQVEGEHFSVMLIPHTLQATNLGKIKVGDALNCEVDILARYCQRILLTQSEIKLPLSCVTDEI